MMLGSAAVPRLEPFPHATCRDFLPTALADGRYRPSPPALVVGQHLDAVPAGLARLRQGVSAQKLVVSLERAQTAAPRPRPTER